MKPKLEMKNQLEALDAQIWSVFEILRGENISPNHYYVTLFLLSAYKDGIISIDVLNDSRNYKESLIDCFNNHENKLFLQYQPIFHSFKPILDVLSEEGIMHIVDSLCTLDSQFLFKYFRETFDRLLYRISKSQGRITGEYIQPVELTRLMCSLADLQIGNMVYNPFAGIASFGVYLNKNIEYFGQEINPQTWALGALRLMAYKRQTHVKFEFGDSILNWPLPSQKYDLIIATPPFGIRYNRLYRGDEINTRISDSYFLERGIKNLTTNGKLIALIPIGFLFRGGQEHRLRKQFIDEDIIDTVISFPSGLMLNTSIPLVILVLNKAKSTPGKVRFVDATNFIEGKGRDKWLNDNELISMLNGYKYDDKVVRYIDNEQIIAKDYNLSVPRYFQKHIEGVRLGDVLEFIRGQRGNLPKTGKLIRVKDLKDDNLNYTLDVTTIEETNLNRSSIHQISESCLFLATLGSSLKPTLFEFRGTPIFKKQDILSFRVKEDKLDIEFLINELHASYVKDQVDAFRIGSTIPFIKLEDLINVVIKLPSLEEQRARVQGISELSQKIKNLQKERNAIVHSNSVKQFNEFASLKHTLGRPRQNILDWTDNLLHFFNSKHDNIEELNKAFADYYDIDIIAALSEIKKDVNFMTAVLEKGENGLNLVEYEMRTIPLSDINNFVNDLSNNGYNFKIEKLLLNSEKLKERGIVANKTLLQTLVDNILTNANKYAFDQKIAGNQVVIELSELDDILILEIKNNGKPFPNNYDREKFITKHSTADTNVGTGLGGYDINRIATYFNNPDWELSLNEDPFYPVKFKFHFPIKLIS